MNGEGPSVPITTLAGIQSLTDLLLELPLPTPLPGSTAGSRSLLFHQRDAEEAQRLLSSRDSILTSQISEALSHTVLDQVEVKDGYCGRNAHCGQTSQLLQCLLSVNPSVFGGLTHLSPTQHHTSSTQWMQPQQFSPNAIYSQQPPYTPTHLSSCSPHSNSPQFSAQESPSYFQVDQPCTSQGGHIQNPTYLQQQTKPQTNSFTYAQGSEQGDATQQQLVHVTSPKHDSLPNDCSPRTLTDVNDKTTVYKSPSVKQTDVVPSKHPPLLVNHSNGDYEAGIKAENLVRNRTENHLCEKVSKPQLPNSNATLCNAINNATAKLPEATKQDSINVSPSTCNAEGQNAVRKQSQETRCATPGTSNVHNSEPPHRKALVNSLHRAILNSVSPKNSSSKKRKNSRANSSSVENEAPNSSPPKRKSVDGPIVVLDKLTVEDQVLAQRSVKQFTLRNTSKSPIPPNDEIDENTPYQKRSDHHSSDTAKRKSSLSNKKETNYRVFTSKRKSKESERNSSTNKHYNQLHNSKRSSSSTVDGKRRRSGQRTSYAESPLSGDGEEPEEEDDSFDNSSLDSVPLSTFRDIKKTQKKRRPKKEIMDSTEDIMDSNTYQVFSRTIDTIFDTMEDIDFTAELDEDAECPTEALLPLFQLKDLCNASAKMKMLKVMSSFPTERLVRLLTILERNVLDGGKLLPMQSMEEQDEEESKLWIELIMERVIRSADSALTCMYIMTAPNMPEKVFLEDVIEKIVVMVNYQLRNTVYPVFDPAYRIDPKSKDGYAGSIKQKRAHAHKVKQKSIIQLYNKLHEIVGLLGELLEIQNMTDTIILQVSTLGVGPFFVEGVSELQLSALRVVTTVFARYNKHRQLILEDILASIARLPTSKRSLRNYRLNSEEHIQMLTALVLQLIHSVVRLPDAETKLQSMLSVEANDKLPTDKNKDTRNVDKDVLITTSYEAAVRTAVNFLSVFLKKCGTKNEEMDYRPLFENFVQDLLSTVNKPEWPASELLLSLLGRLLVQNFSNKSMDMTLRVASLDYLGVVAARLRKDAVQSQLKRESINEVIQQIVDENISDEEIILTSPSKGKKSKPKANKPQRKDETQILQKALLGYLEENMHSDPTIQFAKRFYIAQWYRDAALEIQAEKKEKVPKDPGPTPKSGKNKASRHRGRRSSQVNYEETEEIAGEEEDGEKEMKSEVESEEGPKLLAMIETRKAFLLSVMNSETKKQNMKQENNTIDYGTAELTSRFLASRRPFSQSFDLYLSQILRVLNETAVAVRTKAMKCLSLVVEADPGILARPDMQRGVHARLLDHSTSVREAAVDLVGKFILIRPELTHKYYDMLTERILDTGVSVRKRVIKILKDVCLEQSDFPKIPEICVKIIRRVNDEEGIKKLVGEVFQSMWFTPVPDRNSDRILQKVKNITHVVAACKDIGLEWFEQLLTNLLKNKEDANYKPVLKSCKQIVDCLVENVLLLEESSQESGASENLVACFTTLFLFSKMQPQLVVPHATTIQPYLSMKFSAPSDYLVVQNVARILQKVVPLMEHPSESFLAQIEEDIVKLILRNGAMILPSCVSCLGAVVNKVTRNYQLVRDCFQKFFVVILGFKKEHETNRHNPAVVQLRPKLLRSLFTVGLFCMHFDISNIGLEQTNQDPIRDRVFEVILYFTKQENEEVRLKALTGLGFMLIRHYDLMLGKDVRDLYQDLLSNPMVLAAMKCQVLKNLLQYLSEEEARLIQNDAEWNKISKQEDLKDMDIGSSGMASTVIQIYLKQVLESVLNGQANVRRAALHVIQLTLSQGLVHPVQIVPYLICLGSDDEQVVRSKADQLLQEIEKKYPGFVQMKAVAGVRMSFKLQMLIRGKSIRGYRETDQPTSRNGFLYSTIRGTRQNRRAFVLSLLKLFDEQSRTSLQELLYAADNIVYFPFLAQDEPLFIIHQIDVMLSVSGSNLLQSFREGLIPLRAPDNNQPLVEEDDDDDSFEGLLERLPEDTSVLQECMTASQGCVLLLFVKQTLKEMYGFTDGKIQQYSPNEQAKVYEKALNRKSGVKFKPSSVLQFIQEDDSQGPLDEQGRDSLVKQYLNFKQLMLTIDPSDDDEDDIHAKSRTTVQQSVAGMPGAILGSANEHNAIQPKTEELLTQTPKLVTTMSSTGRSRTKHKTPKSSSREKVKKKHKKKRRRILDSDESGADDPDYE